MARLHLFNPENDIALAAGTANFTPPKAAVALRQAGAALPLWYAHAGDRILCHGINGRWLTEQNTLFGMDVDVFDHIPGSDLTPAPWGWSHAVRREFLSEGFSSDRLPDDEQLELWRQLSHRRTSSALREAIAPHLGFDIAPAAVEINDCQSLATWLAEHPASILKSPWSSSGRGLIDTRRMRPDEVLRRAEGVIRRQGSVMVENAYERTADFALLFMCERGVCRHVGYSLFSTDASGNYNGNYLAPDNMLLATIGKYYPPERITSVASAIEITLTEMIAPVYNGPLGVDMLTAAMPDGTIMIDATVELNLRMTMGFVAHSLSTRYIAEGSTGRFSVRPSAAVIKPASGDTIIENRRIVSGRLMLTPPDGQFIFEAELCSHCRHGLRNSEET